MDGNEKRIDAVYCLIYDEASERIVAVQNENGRWSLPGGRREPGETLPQYSRRSG